MSEETQVQELQRVEQNPLREFLFELSQQQVTDLGKLAENTCETEE